MRAVTNSSIDVSRLSVGFRGERADKASVSQLKNGENIILENNRQNIQTALNNLSANSKKRNIEFLLDVANNLNYGEFGNKRFKEELNKDGITPENRENTDWAAILKDTIDKAMASSKEDVSELKTEYSKVFDSNKELTPEQIQLLELRKELTGAITDKKLLQTAEDIESAANARKNLDYFTASSEIPIKEKMECLKKLIYFMSDDYKINPELKDKKLQVTDEILNDIVIKTPENNELTIKSVNQRVTGICAAISVCRKAMAYENKAGFIDIITEELKDSPTMKVYDITELGSGKKVDVPKTEVKYADALNKGYRIIDASAHIWMNNAHANGDGTIQTEHYIPFDNDSYGIYDDSSWYLGLDDEHADEKVLLAALIKEKEYIKSVYNTQKAQKEVQKNISGVKTEALRLQSNANGTLNKELSEIFPNKTNKEIADVMQALKNFYTKQSPKNEVFIPDKMSDELKQNKITDFLAALFDNITEEEKLKIKEKSKSIDLALTDYVKADEKLQNLQKFNTPKNKFIYYRKLYKAAAAHRLAIEADLNLPDGVLRYEKSAGLPVRNRQIVNYLIKIAEKTGNKEAYNAAIKIESIIPSEINRILKIITDKNMAEIAGELLTHQKQQILEGNDEVLYAAAERLELKPKDKDKIIEKIDKLTQKMASNPSNDEVNDVIRMNYENEIVFAGTVLNAAFHNLETGISDEDYERLSKYFGGQNNIDNGVTRLYRKFSKLSKEYNEIVKKWDVPSSRELILDKMEKNKTVLSRKKLNSLKNHFNYIEKEQASNEKIQNMKERQKADNALYKFSNDEENMFKTVEKNLSSMNRYSNLQYDNLNRILYNELEEQYSAIGMLNGQFWVLEEGSSGLMANEKLRIMEQMTGEPYHIESNAKEAVRQIKQGKGSGVVALSVDDRDYAFHAMYAPSVTQEKFSDKDGAEINEDVLWMDNSWGLAEKEHYWRGKDGFKYTDYDRGFGWKDGFLLRDNLAIGLKVNDVFGSIGVAKEDNDKFGLFKDILLRGTPDKTQRKLDKMFGYIFRVGEGYEQLELLEKAIKDGAKIDIDYIQKVDEAAGRKSEALSQRIHNEIKSEDDFNKLRDDDPIKFAFEKMALYLAVDDPEDAEEVIFLKNKKELDEFHDSILIEHINTMGAIMAKYEDCIDDVIRESSSQIYNLLNEVNKTYNLNFSDEQKNKIIMEMYRDDEKLNKLDGNIDNLEKYFIEQIAVTVDKYIKDEKAKEYFEDKAIRTVMEAFDKEVRINSLDSKAIKNNSLGEYLIAAIDKYFEPSTDEELLERLKGFQKVTHKTAEDFFELLSDEELGFEVKKPYDYVKLFLAEDAAITKAFGEVVEMEEIDRLLPDNEENENDEKNTKSTPEALYRNLHVKLSEMDVQKYIKAYKDEAFKKYKVRQAFPQPVVVEDKYIEQMVDDTLEKINESVFNIKGNKYLLRITEKYEELIEEYVEKDEFKALLNGENIDLNSIDKKKLEEFKKTVNELYEIIKDDKSVDYMAIPLKEVHNALDCEEGEIDNSKVRQYLNKTIECFSDFENSGITPEKLKEMNKQELQNLRKGIHIVVYSNIEPKYSDEAIKQIKNIINLYKKDASEEEIVFYEDKLKDLMTEKHYIKNPTILLQEYIKLLQEGKGESTEALNMKDNLKLSLKVAEQTKVQYKLVQNQHEAISSKTKSKLPQFEIKVEDGSLLPISSKRGTLYLIQQLTNYSDNNVILKLFLSQAGLTKQAAAVLMENIDIPKTVELVENSYKDIKDNIEYSRKISYEAAKFLNQSQIQYTSIKDAISHFETYMRNHLDENSELEAHKEFFKTIEYYLRNKIGIHRNQELYNTILVEVLKSSLENIADAIEHKTDNIASLSKSLSDNQELINSLEIPVDSEEYEKRKKFNVEYNKIYELMEEKEKELTIEFEKYSLLNADLLE